MSDKLKPENYSKFAQECFGHQVKQDVIRKEARLAADNLQTKNQLTEVLCVSLLATGLLVFSFKNKSPSGIALRMKMMKEDPIYKRKIQGVVGIMLGTTFGLLYYSDQALFTDNPYSVGLIGKK
jgi:hypothetical protein